MKMPFGRYKDKDLSEIPEWYLKWLRTQQWLGGWLALEIDLAVSGEAQPSPTESIEDALKKCREASKNKARKRKKRREEKTAWKPKPPDEVIGNP